MNISRGAQELYERYPWTPAIEAGIADQMWTPAEISALLD